MKTPFPSPGCSALVVLSALALLAAADGGDDPVPGPASRPPAIGRMPPEGDAPVSGRAIRIHGAPDRLPSAPAAEASLDDDDLVLGISLGDTAVAFPIRYLGLFEVVNDRVGETPVAATW